MAELIQEGEESMEETGEHIGEWGATRAMGEEVVEQVTQETKEPQR